MVIAGDWRPWWHLG